MFKVFIDGREGTTGLQIYDRLEKRDDAQLLVLPEDKRKDIKARAEYLNSADICFLCLPDDAAREAVSLVENPEVKIIDASTAHRTNPEWVYGFPEISEERRREIAAAKRLANPGCYATGFISVVAPLIKNGIVADSYPFTAFGLSGYSGAGKKTIAVYESNERDEFYKAPRHYALGLAHKHLPEMVRECGLSQSPIFCPVICDYYCGMSVSVPLHVRLMDKKATVKALREMYAEYYARQNYVSVANEDEIPTFLAANSLAGTNELKIYVSGNSEQIFIAAVFDNLGKGASGAAIQNMNIMLGLDERVSI